MNLQPNTCYISLNKNVKCIATCTGNAPRSTCLTASQPTNHLAPRHGTCKYDKQGGIQCMPTLEPNIRKELLSRDSIALLWPNMCLTQKADNSNPSRRYVACPFLWPLLLQLHHACPPTHCSTNHIMHAHTLLHHPHHACAPNSPPPTNHSMRMMQSLSASTYR